jgi:hypothetical protein
MRTELIYSLGQEEVVANSTTAARATRGCDERFEVLVRTETELTLRNVSKDRRSRPKTRPRVNGRPRHEPIKKGEEHGASTTW